MKKLEKEEELSSPTEKKTTKKTTKKTATKTKASKVKIKELEGTGADLAYLIGVTTSNIVQLEQAGTVHRQDNGLYNLVEAVSSYCRNLRERKVGNAKSDIDKETAIWKLQNIKIKNKDWRMARDREVALEIVRALTNAMMELREEAKLNPALVTAIDTMIGRIASINVDSISMAVEGESEEEDE